MRRETTELLWPRYISLLEEAAINLTVLEIMEELL